MCYNGADCLELVLNIKVLMQLWLGSNIHKDLSLVHGIDQLTLGTNHVHVQSSLLIQSLRMNQIIINPFHPIYVQEHFLFQVPTSRPTQLYMSDIHWPLPDISNL